jgi:hypothetical protein
MFFQPGQGSLDQEFRLRAGDQDRRCEFEIESKKGPVSQHIGQGNPLFKLVKAVCQLFAFCGGEIWIGMSQDPGSIGLQNMAEQDLGVEIGGIAAGG